MDIFFWRKNRAIDTFANGLADEFYSRVQPRVAEEFFQGTKQKDKKDSKSRVQIENTLNESIKQLDYFRRVHSLGVYGKARFHLSFTDRLKALGYADDLASRINEILLIKTP